MNALLSPLPDRTDWRPRPAINIGVCYDAGAYDTVDVRNDHIWLLATPSSEHSAVYGDLFRKAWFDALTARATSAPVVFSLWSTTVADRAEPGTAAQRMVSELRSLSGLTNEEIAPLIGVSRRSLQAWIAGEAISARKETRLRAVLETTRSLAANSPEETRCRLLDRKVGRVRPYDLLAEQRYQAALNLALDCRSAAVVEPAARASESLLSQLSRSGENVGATQGKLNRKLSGRLRR